MVYIHYMDHKTLCFEKAVQKQQIIEKKRALSWTELKERKKINGNLSNLLAPVQTIFPELKMRAVVRGSRMRMITAANRFGLYSAFRACSAIFFKSNLHPRFTVHTIFLKIITKKVRNTPSHTKFLQICVYFSVFIVCYYYAGIKRSSYEVPFRTHLVLLILSFTSLTKNFPI